MRLVDTHCHLNFHSYADDFDEILQRAADVGVTRVVIPAIDLETCQQAVDLSQQQDSIFAAAGIHPNSTADYAPGDLEAVEQFATSDRVVAIGEIGLDYHWDKSPKAKQFESFEAQLDLAAKLELPVIIHNREASEDVVQILESWVKDLPLSLQDRPGVLHSFSAPESIAERALAAGFFLGFTGPITFKKSDDLRRIAATVPLDRILVETDGPFLAPSPHRGKRNEPSYIPLIIDRIASLKQLSAEEIATATTANAERLFKLQA